jgi:trehalose 6-phosphate synthase
MNRLVVVSNRIPSMGAGAQAGGLAVALGALLQKRGGLWFGWSGRVGKAAAEKGVELASAGSLDYATLELTPFEHQGYYNRFSNGVLWPLLHTMPELMAYNRRDAQTYREVNARFADSLVPLLRPDDLIWVHDYHLLPLPALLRARGVRNPIGFFLHIPFAAPDVIASAPDLPGMIKGMLAADLVGFQTAHDVENFVAAAQEMAGAVLGEHCWLHLGGRQTRVGVFPVEIDSQEFAYTAALAWRAPPVERLRRSLGPVALVLGIDRLDPTKGLLHRLAGLRRLFEKYPEWQRRVTLLQIAAVSRDGVPSYRELRRELDREAGHLNSDLGDPDWVPLRLVAKPGPREVLAGYMRQAKVGLVTPLRDGMNLVAKEFVAAQDSQDPGALVLSRFAGAARQLGAAVLVNPYDADEVADALHVALRMELSERKARWQEMWQAIERASSLGWGRSFLAALIRAAAAPRLAPTESGNGRLSLAERVRSEIETGPVAGGPGANPTGLGPSPILRPH